MQTDICQGGELHGGSLRRDTSAKRQPEGTQTNLLVDGVCVVKPRTDPYYYEEVNIIKGGVLVFEEDINSKTEFWAKSILVEAGGTVLAGDGTYNDPIKNNAPKTLQPFGTEGGSLKIVLYGPDQSNGNPTKEGQAGKGALCVSPPYDRNFAGDGKPVPDCGVDKDIWNTNGASEQGLPGGVKDYFYKYGSLYGDDALTNGRVGHFGYKVVGLSYDGTLLLRGLKGTTLADASKPIWDSGSSWVRLDADVAEQDKVKTLTLDRDVSKDWKEGDRIVLTTTDYLPDHSEELEITSITPGSKEIGVKLAESKPGEDLAVRWPHVGHQFDVGAQLAKGVATKAAMDATDDTSTPKVSEKAETRAAVALLSRSIQIVSGGDRAGETFDDATNGDAVREIPANAHYAMGGQMVVRQGFRALHVQGVEFKQLGVGGRLAHYPVHFHMARKVPSETKIEDSAVNESMTRWFVVHSTQGVTLQRNVGWKSIGHGYYLETGTETENNFYANIGIFARAGVKSIRNNPREIPGILAENGVEGDPWRTRSDVHYPTAFWITNGWNEFVGNMASGAATCGACYWLQSMDTNHNMIEVSDSDDMSNDQMSKGETWSGYAGMPGRKSPLKLFYRNYCSTAEHAFLTTGEASPCIETVAPWPDRNNPNRRISAIESIAPPPYVKPKKPEDDPYYPNVKGTRIPSVCPPGDTDCTLAKLPDCDNENPVNCANTVVDHFTTSFNWAETNFSAIWLRSPGWFLLDHSFISDVQNGGLTFVTGGDYSRSSSPVGYWSLVSNTVFVGATQPQVGKSGYNPFADERGPHAAAEKLTCDPKGGSCVDIEGMVGYPTANWGTNQRLFNIYDGPAFQTSNAYLNIMGSECRGNAMCMYDGVAGVRKLSKDSPGGYLPNAAIGWKQPNGFYYPPSFHSSNLFFDNVDIRHYVITPVMYPGTYNTWTDKLMETFWATNSGQTDIFTGYTDIDRQTVLNDDDGTLTGFSDTLSVNEDPFFGAPIQAAECLANVGVLPATACSAQKNPSLPSARTNPHQHVTTVLYPDCALLSNRTNKTDPDYTQCNSTAKDVEERQNGNPDRVLKQQFRAGDWSRECTGPFCFGVPIYRQLLTTGWGNADREWQKWQNDKCDVTYDPAKCNWPFVRMSGVNAWQRDVLTANNGTYYIDTTVSKDLQRKSDVLGAPGSEKVRYVECEYQTDPKYKCQPRSVNVFQPPKADAKPAQPGVYNVFFLFATNENKAENRRQTHQTYQMYIGDPAKFSLEDDVKGVLFTGVEVEYEKVTLTNWPKGWTKRMINQDGKDVKEDPNSKLPFDILEVTVDFTDVGPLSYKDGNEPKTVNYDLEPNKKRPETCRPASFCSWSGDSCGCNLSKDDPRVIINPKLLDVCKSTCKDWAVKDFDCPEAGCLGFSFQLPAGFEAKDQYKRPKPKAFPTDATSVWSDKFKRPTGDAGVCSYAANNTPGNPNCGVPD